jgi:hypothetical protein
MHLAAEATMRISLPFHGLDLDLEIEAYHHIEEDPDGKYLDDWWEAGNIRYLGQPIEPSDSLIEAIEAHLVELAEAQAEDRVTP